MLRLVAELYYLRDLRQPDIAGLTGFSVSKVSRLLAQARDSGVVRITVEPATEAPPAIAEAVAREFGVSAIVTPGRANDPAHAARLCGVAAAERLEALLPESGSLGLAGGYTMDALITALPRVERPELQIVPVVGGWDPSNPFLDANELVRRAGERLEAGVRFLHAPGMLDTEATKAALLADSAIAATTSLWHALDCVLVGISGGPLARPGYATVMDRLDEPGRIRLAGLDVAGDLAGHLFRADGSFIEEEWSRRTISITLDDLRRVPRVIAIAAGANKVPAILGALRSGLVHVLATDRATLEGALRLAGLPVPEDEEPASA